MFVALCTSIHPDLLCIYVITANLSFFAIWLHLTCSIRPCFAIHVVSFFKLSSYGFRFFGFTVGPKLHEGFNVVAMVYTVALATSLVGREIIKMYNNQM